MRWSLKLGQVGETTLQVHLTFFLLLVYIAAISWPQGGWPAALQGVVFVLLVFVCVVLHEFGHVLVARRYGIRTPTITLLPIGGIASLEKMPDKPMEELLVAIAGPLVNVVIALVLFLFLGARFDMAEIAEAETAGISLLGGLIAINIMLVVFNLVPAFPLDGGRMLRAILATRFERARATRIAARVGQGFAVLFAVIGLMGNPILLLIAVFMFFAAEAEAGTETMRNHASNHRAGDAMISRFESLSPDATAEDAGKLLLLTTQQEFPVIGRSDGFLGMVTRGGLIQTMQRSGPQTPVTEFMETDLQSVSERTSLDEVMTNLMQGPAQIIAVHGSDGAFVGYISRENATELFMLDQARRREQDQRRRAG